MDISEEELDTLLRHRANPSEVKSHPPDAIPSPGVDYTDLQSAVFGMKSFVANVSAYSGAEFPW